MSQWILIILALTVVALILHARKGNAGRGGSSKGGETRILREGKFVKTDAVFDAWMSADLNRMLRAVDKPTNKVDRHFLLQGIVKECYRQRSDPAMRRTCQEIAELHIHEFPSIAPALKRDMGGTLPRVSTFQNLATLLTEDSEYERAIEVCETAQRFGLEDGTKGGFEARIERIRKKGARGK